MASQLKRLLTIALLLAHVGVPFVRTVDAATFEDLLIQADAARSGEPDVYLGLLASLEQREAEASIAQKQRLRYLKAYQAARSGRFNEAMADLRDLQANGVDIDIRYRAAIFLANNFTAIRDYSEALRALEASLLMTPQITDRDLRNQGMLTAAITYNQVGQYELALAQTEQVLENNPNPRDMCIVQTMQLEARFRMGLHDERSQFEEAINHCVDHGEALIAGFLRAYLARTLANEGHTQAAIDYLETSLPGIKQSRYPRLISELHALLAEYHLRQGRHAQAELNATQATEHADGALFTEHVVAAHRTLYEIAMHRGDTASALEHHRRYAEADRAYMDNIKARELAFQIVNHETLQKNQTIELLNRRNQVLQLEQQVATQTTTNQRLMMAILVLLLASIAYWAYKVKKLQVSFRLLSETDTLTGLSNRRHFQREATRLLTQGQRVGNPKSVIMLDLDFFKRVNDQYGHASGDWVLRRVGEECRAIVRSGDMVSRMGGEEFVLFLRACPLAAALDLAERCRQRIEAIDTSDTGHHFRVTASFGVADTVHAGYDLTELLKQADAALYCAKADGRNRVATADAVIDNHAGDAPPHSPSPEGGLRIVSG